MKESTRIRVQGVTWWVPRGFGRAYAQAAKDDLSLDGAANPGEVIEQIVSLLALIGYSATTQQVAGWDLRRRVEAVIYASVIHAHAGDNPVRRHPRPAWIPKQPWQGPQCGHGAFAGPGGTPIPEPHADQCSRCGRPESLMCCSESPSRIAKEAR